MLRFYQNFDSKQSIQATFQIKTKIKFPTACVGSVRGHHNRRTVQENQKLRRLEIS